MADPATRFVQLLVAGGVAVADGKSVQVVRSGRRLSIPMGSASDLQASGVLARDGECWRAGPDARSWLRRALLDGDTAHADQHRTLKTAGSARVNLAESPLARLAAGQEGAAFLAPHHVEAGERVRRLCERAALMPRLTMRYAADQIAGHNAGGPADISDMSAEARRGLADIHRVLPPDCAGVVLDVCGLLKGLQLVESERGWPRRSAKLVLRIGLDQLARHYGLSPEAVGRERSPLRPWMEDGARPTRFE